MRSIHECLWPLYYVTLDFRVGSLSTYMGIHSDKNQMSVVNQMITVQTQPTKSACPYQCLLCSAGLIDYNFHCFRKAIHEVFEVGMTNTRTVSTPTGTPCLMKGVALNGTPRSTVQTGAAPTRQARERKRGIAQGHERDCKKAEEYRRRQRRERE